MSLFTKALQVIKWLIFFLIFQCQNAALDELFGNPKEVTVTHFHRFLSSSGLLSLSSCLKRFFFCGFESVLFIYFLCSVRRSTRLLRFCFKASRKKPILTKIGVC